MGTGEIKEWSRRWANHTQLPLNVSVTPRVTMWRSGTTATAGRSGFAVIPKVFNGSVLGFVG